MKETTALQNCRLEDIHPVEDLGRLVSYLRSSLIAQIDTSLTPMELTSAQYIVVVLLARGTVSTLAELCEHMQYDRGAMSRLISRLECKGLVSKKQLEHDRRSSIVYLTEKGQQLYPQILPLVNAIYETTLTGFNEQERQQFATLLFKAIHNLKT